MKMTPIEARTLLEDPASRMEHLGASLFTTCANVQDWFEDHPEFKPVIARIDLGYAAAGLLAEAAAS